MDADTNCSYRWNNSNIKLWRKILRPNSQKTWKSRHKWNRNQILKERPNAKPFLWSCSGQRDRKRLIVCFRMPSSMKKIPSLLLKLLNSEHFAFRLGTWKEQRRLYWKENRSLRRGSKYSVMPIWIWVTFGHKEKTIRKPLITTRKSSRPPHITILKLSWITNPASIQNSLTHSQPTSMLTPILQSCTFSWISLRKAFNSAKNHLSWNLKNQNLRSILLTSWDNLARKSRLLIIHGSKLLSTPTNMVNPTTKLQRRWSSTHGK